VEKHFSKIASVVAHAAGKPTTFVICCLIIVAWAFSGPIFGFSDTWQLIINTGTTIVTFLMVFLIQNTQNRDGVAIQVKLDELIRVTEAQNRFVGIEHLTESEVEQYRALTEKAAKAADRARKAEAKADEAEEEASAAEEEASEAEEGAAEAAATKRKRSRRKARATVLSH
jgi:low affinity Fe/Cu permease